MTASSDPSSDPRGGLFIDSGDGRGAIHTDDMTPADRAAHGLPPKPDPSDSPDATQEVAQEAILIEDADNA